MTPGHERHIDVLTVTECPHRDLTLERIRDALVSLGLKGTTVAEQVIDDPIEALRAGMHGSPTVLIDGHDPFTASGIEASVSCRLYPTANGYDGAPSVDDLVAALAQLGSDRR